MKTRALLDSIDHIYAAGLDPQLWPAALEAITAIIPEAALALFGQRIAIEDEKNGTIRYADAITTNIRPETVEQYSTYYGPKSVWLPLLLGIKVGQVVTGGPWQAYRGTEFFEDWALPNQLECAVGVKLNHNNKGIAVLAANYSHRYEERIEARCIRLFQTLAPHMQRAVKMNQILSRFEQCEQCFEVLVERIAGPAFIVDQKLQILHLNELAQQALNAKRGISLSAAGLRFASAKAQAAIRDEVALWCQGPRLSPTGEPAPVIFDVVDEPGPNLAWVLPLVKVRPAKTPPFLMALNREPRIAMIVLKYRRDVQIEPAIALAAAFALTEAETRLTRGLVCGRSIKEYADFEGISENTARWHLKNILLKTNCRNQSELIQLFSVFSMPIF